jgi:hypothetical protein
MINEVYACKRCGHESSTKSNLLQHLGRKKQCPTIYNDISILDYINEIKYREYNEKTYDCVYCQKKFNTWQSKSRHTKTCPKKVAENTVSIDQFIKMKNEIDHLKQKLEDINLPCPLLSTTNNQSIISNANNTTNNIHINSFGRETFDHLPLDFLNSCFMMKNMESLVENIYFDKDCPENHNVKLKSSKQKTVEVFDDGLWRVKHSDDIADDMINKGHNLLYSHYRKNKDAVKEDMSEVEIEEVLDWLHRIFQNDNITRQPIKRELIMLFQTFRHQFI